MSFCFSTPGAYRYAVFILRFLLLHLLKLKLTSHTHNTWSEEVSSVDGKCILNK